MRKIHFTIIFLLMLFSVYFFFNFSSSQIAIKSAETFSGENVNSAVDSDSGKPADDYLKANPDTKSINELFFKDEPAKLMNEPTKENSIVALSSGKNLTKKPGRKFVYRRNLVLTIDGERVTAKDVEKKYDRIPVEARKNLTLDDILEDMVNEKLLIHAADKKKIKGTDKEVDEYLKKVRDFNKLNESELEREIIESGYTIEEYRKSVKETFAVSKLIDRDLNVRNVTVSDSEVNDFVQKNKETFRDIFDEGDPELENMLKEKVKQKLNQEKRRQVVNTYVESLRQKAQISEGGGV